MTPEKRNSSLLGNGGKHVPAEMYTHAATEGKHTSVTIEDLLGDGVFCAVRAEIL
jgi:hypothetical protein